MLVQTWGDVLIASFQELWGGVVSFVPKLVVAFVVFLVGWVIAVTLGKVVSQVVRSLKLDSLLRGAGAEAPLSRAGMKLDSGEFLGGLVRWFFIVVLLLGAMDVLGLSQVTEFLRSVVLTYIPQVIVAALILLVAAVLADVVYRIVGGAARAAHLPSAGFLGGIAKWAIWVFAILAALFQLGIAGVFIQTLFTAFVGMVAIAGGLAFGLGGKEAAGRFLDKLRAEISNR